MNTKAKLILVYRAHSKGWGKMIDFGHKIISPSTYSCSLCSLTHGVFKPKKEWIAFLESLNMEVVFYHQDDWPDRETMQVKLPLVLICENSKNHILMNADYFKGIKNVTQLISDLKNQLNKFTDAP